MGRNRLSQSTRLAPRNRITLKLLLQYVVPVGFTAVGIFLIQIHPGQVEVSMFENISFMEIVAEEGMRGFMP